MNEHSAAPTEADPSTNASTNAGREQTFETIEAQLEAITEKLEEPTVPLEERLRLHARAVRLHATLEGKLDAAEKAIQAAEKAAVPAEPDGEPYEAVRDRLAEIVNALENEELPLDRVVALHLQAGQLAARCETILKTARTQLDAVAEPPSDGSEEPDPAPVPRADPGSAEEWDDPPPF